MDATFKVESASTAPVKLNAGAHVTAPSKSEVDATLIVESASIPLVRLNALSLQTAASPS